MGPGNSPWRLFVAVQIGEDVRKNLADLQSRLRKRFANVRWVSPENIHLTLVFLGDVSPEKAPELSSALKESVERIPAFACGVGELGLFGPARAPRVVWVGINEGAAPLLVLHQAVTDRLRTQNLTIETREFAPHLTLGRIKLARDAKGLADALAAEAKAGYGTIRVNSVDLMRSELMPQGPSYTVVSSASLATRVTPQAATP